MICYKFKYIDETAVQTIKTPCSSSIFLGIPIAEGETVTFGSYSTSQGTQGYVNINLTTPATPSVKNYTATITGTVDETEYTHTIHIRVISSIVSYGEIMEGQG